MESFEYNRYSFQTKSMRFYEKTFFITAFFCGRSVISKFWFVALYKRLAVLYNPSK